MSNKEKNRTSGKNANGKKVFVGMSGGVDSSVAAALLVGEGYDVTGVFIKVWQPEKDMLGPGSALACTWREDRLDAMRVAAQLGIRFVTLDLEDEYKRNVVDYMIAEYRAGRTPNPDVMCNKYVKFGGFFDWAMRPEQGADYVATGHYAQVAKTQVSENTGSSDIRYDLLAGDDANKDQSYFLWTLTQKQLAKTLFPVGNIEKPQVRKLARKFRLPTAEKKDSQGLCFIGKIDIKEFLSQYIEPKEGDVLSANDGQIGEKTCVIGRHNGAFFFTLGERHGFTIFDEFKTPNDEPYYVVEKNIEKNIITVAHSGLSAHSSKISAQNMRLVRLNEVNWTRGDISGKKYMARARYRALLAPVSIKSFDEKSRTAEMQFELPSSDDKQLPVLSPGQSVVIYEGNVCLGGGIIS